MTVPLPARLVVSTEGLGLEEFELCLGEGTGARGRAAVEPEEGGTVREDEVVGERAGKDPEEVVEVAERGSGRVREEEEEVRWCWAVGGKRGVEGVLVANRGEEGMLLLVEEGVGALMEAIVRIRRKILPSLGSPSCWKGKKSQSENRTRLGNEHSPLPRTLLDPTLSALLLPSHQILLPLPVLPAPNPASSPGFLNCSSQVLPEGASMSRGKRAMRRASLLGLEDRRKDPLLRKEGGKEVEWEMVEVGCCWRLSWCWSSRKWTTLRIEKLEERVEVEM